MAASIEHVGAVPREGVTKPPTQGRRVTVSLRILVPLVSALILAGGVIGTAVISEHQSRALLNQEIHTRLLLQARNLGFACTGALLEEFPELTLQPLVRDLLGSHPEISSVAILDRSGIVQGHHDNQVLGRVLTVPQGMSMRVEGLRLRKGEELLMESGRTVAVTQVVHSSGKRLGTVIVTMRAGYLEDALSQGRRKQWLLLSILLALGGVSALGLMRFIIHPVGALQQGLERIGQGDLKTPLALGAFTEIAQLAGTVNRMSSQLILAQGAALRRERLESEIELASRIQNSLLPPGPMRVGPFALAARYRAAAEVGGDYVDMFPLADGRIGVAIADVSGKGVAGCLMMAMLASLLRALREDHSSPRAMLVLLEQQLSRSLQRGSFVTICYGVLDPASGKLTFASAGHLPMLILRAGDGSAQWIRSRAVPLGAVRGGHLARTLLDDEIALEAGDVVVQLTDGFSEGMHPETYEQFGFERIEAVARKHAELGAEAVVEALYTAVHEWTGMDIPDDDQTLLVLRRERAQSGSSSAEDTSLLGGAPGPSPLRVLSRGRADGSALVIGMESDLMKSLREWLARIPQAQSLPFHHQRLIESALYEACGNVLEHGYQNRAGGQLELVWAPPEAALEMGMAAQPIAAGWFVLRDDAPSHDPMSTASPDINDPVTRRRGRGLGVEMLRRIMTDVSYHAGTPEGNLLLMRYARGNRAHARRED